MRNIPLQRIQDSLYDLIGLPYSSFDCYELVRFFYKKVFSIELESLYQLKPTDDEATDLVAQQKEKFIEVTTPQFGDIILISVVGLPCHIGIYINSNEFLHTREVTGSVIEKLPRWEKRIRGYYRCPKLKLD